jgi:type II secretory pathway pseudopilin PulG
VSRARNRLRTARARRAALGLTLVEVALLISLGGILLAVGIPGFVRALHTSKMSEAPEELSRIYAATAAYHAKSPHCLPEPAGPTPAKPSQKPVAVRFADPEAPGSSTWQALGFEPSRPIRYRYTLAVPSAGCQQMRDSRDQFVVSVRAEGDLDGDGVLSLFERNASMRDGALELDRLLVIRDAVE